VPAIHRLLPACIATEYLVLAALGMVLLLRLSVAG
jgi:hypothetical protein